MSQDRQQGVDSAVGQRDQAQERRDALAKSNWKVTEKELYTRFGEAAANSRRFLEELYTFALSEASWENAWAVLEQAQRLRRQGTVKQQGTSKKALWTPSDVKKAMLSMGKVTDGRKQGVGKRKLVVYTDENAIPDQAPGAKGRPRGRKPIGKPMAESDPNKKSRTGVIDSMLPSDAESEVEGDAEKIAQEEDHEHDAYHLATPIHSDAGGLPSEVPAGDPAAQAPVPPLRQPPGYQTPVLPALCIPESLLSAAQAFRSQIEESTVVLEEAIVERQARITSLTARQENNQIERRKTLKDYEVASEAFDLVQTYRIEPIQDMQRKTQDAAIPPLDAAFQEAATALSRLHSGVRLHRNEIRKETERLEKESAILATELVTAKAEESQAKEKLELHIQWVNAGAPVIPRPPSMPRARP
ncbi:MAG: hypothetical protein Q9211_002053 [Gyalolechia sp. 1 TL-2023]